MDKTMEDKLIYIPIDDEQNTYEIYLMQTLEPTHQNLIGT